MKTLVLGLKRKGVWLAVSKYLVYPLHEVGWPLGVMICYSITFSILSRIGCDMFCLRLEKSYRCKSSLLLKWNWLSGSSTDTDLRGFTYGRRQNTVDRLALHTINDRRSVECSKTANRHVLTPLFVIVCRVLLSKVNDLPYDGMPMTSLFLGKPALVQ